jgi:hypothetical protein
MSNMILVLAAVGFIWVLFRFTLLGGGGYDNARRAGDTLGDVLRKYRNAIGGKKLKDLEGAVHGYINKPPKRED